MPRQYIWPMSGIAAKLDEKLKGLDPKAALSLEKLVRDALELVDVQNGKPALDSLPQDFFRRVAAEFGNEPFERPPQGDFERREDW